MNTGFNNMKHETAVQTVNAVPAITGGVMYTVTLNHMIGVATLLYILLQGAYLIWKWIREAKKK